MMATIVDDLVAAGLPGDDAARAAREAYFSTAGGMIDALVEAYAADCDALALVLTRRASPEVRRKVLRELVLNHPRAIEDNGRITLDLPHEFSHRYESSVRFLADWLAPEETE